MAVTHTSLGAVPQMLKIVSLFDAIDMSCQREPFQRTSAPPLPPAHTAPFPSAHIAVSAPPCGNGFAQHQPFEQKAFGSRDAASRD
jgi:hypothetical protein